MTDIPKRVELMYPSEYLKSADLVATGVAEKGVVLHLSSIARETLRAADNTEKVEWVAEFAEMQERAAEDQKRWVLCKTNTYRLSWHLGGELSDWIGKPFRLGVETVGAQGRSRVPALRVMRDPSLQNENGKTFAKTLVDNAWKRWWSL